jgi:hypothetical protein
MTLTLQTIDAIIWGVEQIMENPSLGWIPTLIYLFIELRSKRGIVHGRLMKMIKANTVVVRAIARTNDEIETEAVEELLTDNGHEPSDFINVRQTQNPNGEDSIRENDNS